MSNTTPPEIDLELADQYASAAVDAFAEEFTSGDERAAAEGLRTMAAAYLEFRKGTLSTADPETKDQIAGLRSELHKTRIERDQAKLEVLPPGWYWDTAPGEVRARNIDGVSFCSPPVGAQLRAIGVIPPAVQMAVGLRAKRLAIEPTRWGVLLDECEGSERFTTREGYTHYATREDGKQFATREAALEYGQETAVREFWAGPLQRARASEMRFRVKDIAGALDDRAVDNVPFGWIEDDLFSIRQGAQELFDVALDTMFESRYWTIDTSETNRHEVPQKPSADEGDDKNTDPPTCTGVGTVSAS